MKGPFKHALASAATLLLSLGAHAAAHAGEITLFEDDNFRGRSVTLRETSDNLTPQGFNDKASSIMVRSGTWEVCTDSGFRGNCRTLGPGEYRSLPGMNDAITSVRETVRGNDYNPGRPGRDPDRGNGGHGGYGRGSTLEVYSGAGQNGGSARLNRDTDDFVDIGFNDRTSSIVIYNGYWQLCSDSNYNGTCRVFGPGRHDDLGRGLDGRVSSARMVDEREARRQQQYENPYQRPRYEQPYSQYPQQQYPQRGAILLFPDAGMRGEPLALDRSAEDLVRYNFNDRAGSIVVNDGQWEVCSDANFRGRCEVIGPGEYGGLNALDNKISSLRRVR
ncbi:beta/gamma crystallin-related protein [Janthinobacterium sp. 1_2014MBL_MicDiv]|uniref:beta/gamma crystallin-related protein n=1 Tax=Janthinobacterium sp. 1_2014MBL_MicDiv TaxID=1644131 RepID=UPI0008F4821F|nr:beta/gamma crystallin-related protein [Janthinobacterium sp. 1_2014MBL_MicDiv]